MCELWNKRREKLEEALIEAALELSAHTGADAFQIPVPGTSPQLFVRVGDFTEEPANE